MAESADQMATQLLKKNKGNLRSALVELHHKSNITTELMDNVERLIRRKAAK